MIEISIDRAENFRHIESQLTLNNEKPSDEIEIRFVQKTRKRFTNQLATTLYVTIIPI